MDKSFNSHLIKEYEKIIKTYFEIEKYKYSKEILKIIKRIEGLK